MKITHLRGGNASYCSDYQSAISVATIANIIGDGDTHIKYSVVFQHDGDQFVKKVASEMLYNNINSPSHYKIAKMPKYAKLTHDNVMLTVLCDLYSSGKLPSSKVSLLLDEINYRSYQVNH